MKWVRLGKGLPDITGRTQQFFGMKGGFQPASLEVGLVNATTLVVRFNHVIKAAGNDFKTGVTVKVAGSGRTVNSGTLQTDQHIVYYVLASAVSAGQAVTWEYNGTTGKITDSSDVKMASIGPLTVTNSL